MISQSRPRGSNPIPPSYPSTGVKGEDRERQRTLSVADPSQFVSRLEFAYSPFTLKFKHRDLGYEEEYLEGMARRVRNLVKWSYWIVFIFWLPFTYIDYAKTEGDNQIGILGVRGVTFVLCGFLAWSSHYPQYIHFHQILSSLGIGALSVAMEISLLLTDTMKDGPATIFVAFLAGPFVTQQQFQVTLRLMSFLFVSFGVTSWFGTTLPQWASMNLVSLTVICVGLIHRYTSEVKSRKNFILRCQIRREREALEVEKDKSDALLLNILPQEISERLKEKEGNTISDRHDVSTVLFTDIVGFDRHSNRLSAQDVVLKLNEVICAFDLICEEHGIEKIKTIGTTFMAVAGVPSFCEDHAQRAARTAVAMHKALPQICAEIGIPLQLMTGLNSGPTVAGVIGTTKISYDVWGDSVNMASRMESNSEPGKIQLSEATYELLRYCDEFLITPRGTIEVKGKGKVPSYYLTEASKGHTTLTKELMTSLAPIGVSNRRRSTFRDDQISILTAVSRESSPRMMASGLAQGLQDGDNTSDAGTSVTGVSGSGVGRGHRASFIDDMGLASPALVSRAPSRRPSDLFSQGPSRKTSGYRSKKGGSASKYHSGKGAQSDMPTLTDDGKTPGGPDTALAELGEANSSTDGSDSGDVVAPPSLEKQLSQFVHKYTMIFIDEHVEHSYKRHLFDEMLPVLRKYMLMGLFLFIAFGLIDIWLYPEVNEDITMDMYLIRAFGALLIIAFFATTYHPIFYKISTIATCIVACYPSLYGTYIQSTGRPYVFYIMRMSVLVLYIYTIPLVPHLMLALTAWVGTIAWLVSAMLKSDEAAGELLVSFLVLIIAHIFGLIAAYNREVSSRLDFLLLRRLREEHKKLDAQKSLTEALLYNILPRRVARKLIADPRANIAERFPEAVVLFSDIVSFTKMSSSMSPQEVVHMLNTMFVGFDKAANNLRLEKIKTIGDAYMVAGLPIGNIDAVRGMAEMALAMMDHMEWMRANGFPDIRIRIGINMGPVLAGIIGIRKFIYDIFGPNVTLGNKMEELGVPSKTHVPDNFYQRLKDEYNFEKRDELITVEGFGTFQTYLLVGRKPHAAPPGYIDAERSKTDLFIQEFEEQEEVLHRFRNTISVQ